MLSKQYNAEFKWLLETLFGVVVTSRIQNNNDNSDISCIFLDHNFNEINEDIVNVGEDDTPWKITLSNDVIILSGSVKRNTLDGYIIKYRVKDTGNFNQCSAIKLFPNPTSNFLIIENQELDRNAKFEFRIFLSDGKLIWESDFSDKSAKIDVNNFAQGLYILQISGSSCTLTHKFEVVKN